MIDKEKLKEDLDYYFEVHRVFDFNSVDNHKIMVLNTYSNIIIKAKLVLEWMEKNRVENGKKELREVKKSLGDTRELFLGINEHVKKGSHQRVNKVIDLVLQQMEKYENRDTIQSGYKSFLDKSFSLYYPTNSNVLSLVYSELLYWCDGFTDFIYIGDKEALIRDIINVFIVEKQFKTDLTYKQINISDLDVSLLYNNQQQEEKNIFQA
ncbi:MAG: hypothetical protein OIF32_00270 [Campylobacterales bacterium]|nr:hypothetical protein [Campylobacterales bacterium]